MDGWFKLCSTILALEMACKQYPYSLAPGNPSISSWYTSQLVLNTTHIVLQEASLLLHEK